MRRYDWPTGRFAAPIAVPVAPALVLEGCGSAPRADWLRRLDQEAVEFTTEGTGPGRTCGWTALPPSRTARAESAPVEVSHGWNTAAAPWVG